MDRSKTRRLKRLFQKAVTVNALVDIMVGVVGDVLGSDYPPDSAMSIAYDKQDLHNIGGFYQVQEVVDDMTANAVGRLTRFLLLETGEDVNPDEATLKALLSTQEVEQEAVPKIMVECLRKYGYREVNQEALQAWQKKLTDLIKRLMGDNDTELSN